MSGPAPTSAQSAVADAGGLLSGLAAAARVERAALLDLAEGVAVRMHPAVLEPPRAAAVALEVDSAAGEFVLADVVVTSALVRVGERTCPGYALGWDDEGALAAALTAAGEPEEAARLAAAATAREARDRAATTAAVRATRVAPG